MNLQQIKKTLNDNAELVFSKLGMKCEVFSDNIYSTCPIHDGSDNPRAFSYSINKNIWKCWTRDCQCEYENDIFGLIRGALSVQTGKELEFKDVLKWSCDLLNIKNTSKSKKIEKPVDDNTDAFFNVIKVFNSKKSESTSKPIDINNLSVQCPSKYFIDREFEPSTLEYFGVGDSINNGIMKDRAIIPIHNDDGSDIISIIGRSTKEYKLPKFLFYPKGFDKRFYLYNFHRAVSKAVETSCLYILEGQGDVWRMYEAGVKNAVSIFGKTITDEQQEKLLKLPITHLIVLTDNDQAGRESKIQIKRQLGRMYKLTFPKLSTKDIGEMSVEQIQNTILHNLKGTY